MSHALIGKGKKKLLYVSAGGKSFSTFSQAGGEMSGTFSVGKKGGRFLEKGKKREGGPSDNSCFEGDFGGEGARLLPGKRG